MKYQNTRKYAYVGQPGVVTITLRTCARISHYYQTWQYNNYTWSTPT